MRRKESIKKQVFLDDLPKNKGGKGSGNANEGTINWRKTAELRCKVRFIHGDVEGYVEIIGYDSPKLEIQYKDVLFKISVSNFRNCQLGILLGKRTEDFKVEIGQTFKDDKRDLTIINKEYREKVYKNNNKINYKHYQYKCNKCGYDKGWIVEGNLLQGKGCSCCCIAPKDVIIGINDIPTTAPFMVKFFQGGYDEAKKYTYGSDIGIVPICPDCGRVRDKEIKISDIFNKKSIGCNCSDGISFPEKFVYNLLEKLEIKITTQLSKTTFKWCGKYRYDFYFEYNNEKYIVEAHGSQHPNTRYYNNGFENLSKKTYEQELQNDINKKNLALFNGIKEDNYIVIDCSLSDKTFIKNEILNSVLYKIFDLTIVDWDECEKYALSNRVKEACEIKRDNPYMTTTDIGKMMNLNSSTILNYLKKGSEIWDWINYDGKEELKMMKSKSKKRKGYYTEIFKDGKSLGVFISCHELERCSERLFGVKLNRRIIARVSGKEKEYNGYTFKYV